MFMHAQPLISILTADIVKWRTSWAAQSCCGTWFNRREDKPGVFRRMRSPFLPPPPGWVSVQLSWSHAWGKAEQGDIDIHQLSDILAEKVNPHALFMRKRCSAARELQYRPRLCHFNHACKLYFVLCCEICSSSKKLWYTVGKKIIQLNLILLIMTYCTTGEWLRHKKCSIYAVSSESLPSCSGSYQLYLTPVRSSVAMCPVSPGPLCLFSIQI